MLNHHEAIAAMALLLAFPACRAWSADPPPNGFATTLRYADFGTLGTARQVLTDRAGNVVVVGVIVNRPAPIINPQGVRPDTSIAVIKLDNTGHVVFRFVFGGTGYNDPRGAAMDADGNVYIGGLTAADDFPLVNALISRTLPQTDVGFISKVDATGSRLVFSTRVSGGTAVLFPDWPIVAEVNALALDAQSNVYITGTISRLLPPIASQNDAFVVKISSAGDRLMYSTLLGGVRACGGNDFVCMYSLHYSVGVAIAVDSSGQATIAGSTNAGVPVTPRAFQTQCEVTVPNPPHVVYTGFVSRLNARGTALVWSTCLGGGPSATSYVASDGGVSAIALDDAGNVFVGGYTGAANFPITPGVLGPTNPNFGQFAAKLDATGTSLLYSTYLAVNTVNAIAGDSQGHAWVTSPAVPNSSGNDLLIELDTDASRLLQSYRLPAGSVGPEVIALSPRNVLTLGSSGEVLDWFFGDTSGPSLTGFANAAATTVSGRVAPGEIVSIYGVRLGPTPAVGARLDADGRVATSLGGVQVMFDGRPAPLVYVSDTQINAIAPFEISGKASTTVQIVTLSGSPPPLTLTVVPADPGLFRSSTGTVAALNQDGTINSSDNRATRGSIISLYATGGGLLDPIPDDGTITATGSAKLVQPVSVMFDSVPAEIRYAGAAPGLVAGVVQINVLVPASANSSLSQLLFGTNFNYRSAQP